MVYFQLSRVWGFCVTSLKEWHFQHVQNLEGRMLEIKNKMSVLDVKAENVALQTDEASELRELSLTLHTLARLQNSMNWQKSRLNWLKEGDANSKIFHSYMSYRRRQNAINVVSVEGGTVEGVHNIRETVFHHFSSHFKNRGAARPSVDGLNFCKLSCVETGILTESFSLEEVKQAVWDCGSYKSPGPDGVSFGFIK
jgi:hypothetical protein